MSETTRAMVATTERSLSGLENTIHTGIQRSFRLQKQLRTSFGERRSFRQRIIQEHATQELRHVVAVEFRENLGDLMFYAQQTESILASQRAPTGDGDSDVEHYAQQTPAEDDACVVYRVKLAPYFKKLQRVKGTPRLKSERALIEGVNPAWDRQTIMDFSEAVGRPLKLTFYFCDSDRTVAWVRLAPHGYHSTIPPPTYSDQEVLEIVQEKLEEALRLTRDLKRPYSACGVYEHGDVDDLEYVHDDDIDDADDVVEVDDRPSLREDVVALFKERVPAGERATKKRRTE
jgi:hypothetical protein